MIMVVWLVQIGKRLEAAVGVAVLQLPLAVGPHEHRFDEAEDPGGAR